jgi:hypothetical protein
MISDKRHILIAGSSYVYWAGKLENKRRLQRYYQLQQSIIHFVGRPGAGVRNFQDLVNVVKGATCRPSVVVLHLGGNDIGKRKALEIIGALTELKSKLEKKCKIKVVLSEILHRKNYKFSYNVRALEKVRKNINSKLNNRAPGEVIRHRLLDGTEGQYRHDGIHLTDEIGTPLFLHSIFRFLEHLNLQSG